MSRAELVGAVVLFGVLAGTACGPAEHASADSSVEEADSAQQPGVAEALELYVEGMVAGDPPLFRSHSLRGMSDTPSFLPRARAFRGVLN